MAAPPPGSVAKDFPWWLVAAGLLAVSILAAILLDPVYGGILATLSKGVVTTAYVTVVAFALASALGLGLAVCVLSGSVVVRQAARFYIEIVRGIPILVLLFYIASATWWSTGCAATRTCFTSGVWMPIPRACCC